MLLSVGYNSIFVIFYPIYYANENIFFTGLKKSLSPGYLRILQRLSRAKKNQNLRILTFKSYSMKTKEGDHFWEEVAICL